MPSGFKVGIAVIVMGWVLYALTPDHHSTASDTPVHAAGPAAPDDTGPRFEGAWWTTAAPCPDGAVLRGGPPPDGREVWCALADGTRHGPHAAWWPNGRQHFERTYDNGRVDGPWKKWRPDGQPWAAGAYREGVRTGRWVTWNDLDAASITDYP